MIKPREGLAQLSEARSPGSSSSVSLGRVDDSEALGEALARDEALVARLEAEVEHLEQASDSRVRFPSCAWVEQRLVTVHDLLERRTEASALLDGRRLPTTRLTEAPLSDPAPRLPMIQAGRA